MNYKENKKENKVEDISNRTMEIIRTFEAPVELLWKVLTTPEYPTICSRCDGTKLRGNMTMEKMVFIQKI